MTEHTKATTLTGLLDEKTAENAGEEKRRYFFLTPELAISAELTYTELSARAKSIAALLQKHKIKKGDRILLLYQPGLEFICAFLGCLYAGAVAIPCYPPVNKKLVDKISAVINNSQPKVILSTTEIVSKIKKLRYVKLAKESIFLRYLLSGFMGNLSQLTSWDFDKFSWLTSDNVLINARDTLQPVEILPDDIAFLQYTSGSTSAPKGVIVTHRNLVSNIGLISESVRVDGNDSVVTWLPPYHDMGLIGGIFVPLYNNIPVYIMSPMDFLKRPYNWLHAISLFSATISVAPNFAYGLCNKKITDEQVKSLNLQTWRAALNGAEPVNFQVMKHFSEKFSLSGFRESSFYPCYGLAESTLFVAGKFGLTTRRYSKAGLREHKLISVDQESHDAQTLVSCGHVLEGLAIIDPETKEKCCEGIGEICLSGASVTQGYWQHPANEENFFIFNENGQTIKYFKTGDLGFIADNELYITGRMKELIIIRGTNHYPQDIEDTVYQASDKIRHGCCAAFSLDKVGEECLGIVAEVQPGLSAQDYKNIFSAIKINVMRHHQLDVQTIAFIEPKSLHKTTSGKIQRYANRRTLLNHEFNVLAEYEAPYKFVEEKHQPIKEQLHEKIFISPHKDLLSTSHVSPANVAQSNLREKMKMELRHILDLPEGAPIKDEQSFSEYGLDSLMAVELENKLQHHLQGSYHLTPNDVFDYPSIAELSDHIENEMKKNKTANV